MGRDRKRKNYRTRDGCVADLPILTVEEIGQNPRSGRFGIICAQSFKVRVEWAGVQAHLWLPPCYMTRKGLLREAARQIAAADPKVIRMDEYRTAAAKKLMRLWTLTSMWTEFAQSSLRLLEVQETLNL